MNNHINYIIFIIGLIIASVAGFYSVMGLTMIFAGAFWPIVVMASSIELAKVACTSWLSRYWSNSPATIRYYLAAAIIVLSLITSLGVFGFLSKAHITTTTVIGYTKETFSSGGGEWLIYGTQGRSYSDTTSNPTKYSCYVSDGNDYGIYVSPTAINDDLILYIGLKNTVAL